MEIYFINLNSKKCEDILIKIIKHIAFYKKKEHIYSLGELIITNNPLSESLVIS